MALDQSALLEVLEALKAADVGESNDRNLGIAGKGVPSRIIR